MDISGSYTLKAPRERVWECLLDPDMLQRTIPGCEKLEQIGPDEWRMRVNIGIAAVKGVYEGTLRMSDRVPPETYRMVADGTGARSVIHGEGTLKLEAPDANSTVVNYQGEAQINGPLAGIANRVAPSVSKMLLKQFFGRFQQEMDATGASAPVAAATISADDTNAMASAASAPEASHDTNASAVASTTPVAATTAPPEEVIADASTSGVWEMSLPEARPLDGEQGPATALPLDPAPAATSASNAPDAASSAALTADGDAPPASDMPTTGATTLEDVSANGATPAAATSAPAAPAADAIFDASTSGVWEMSLPEARPLDGEQGPATALPLDPAPAAAPATTSPAPAAAPATTSPAPAAAPATTSPAPAAPSATPAPSATAPTPATSATSSGAQPATITSAPASVAPMAMASSTASATANATMAAGQRAGGGFMAWLKRLFGRAS